MAEATCHYCGRSGDLRPYGPNHSFVCFTCATATPERNADAQRNFGRQLDVASCVAVVDGSGPYPAQHHHDERVRQLANASPLQ